MNSTKDNNYRSKRAYDENLDDKGKPTYTRTNITFNWRLMTNLAHDPVEIRDVLDNVIVDLRKIRFPLDSEVYKVIDQLINKHNEFVKHTCKI